MNRLNFGVVVKKWRFKVLRNCVLLMMTVITLGQADAGLLPETPTPQGGDIVGSWIAEKIELNAYVPAALVQIVSPVTVEGEINGTLIFDSDGSVQANYTIEANVSAVLFAPISVPVHDMSQYTGNYMVMSDTHALTITRENEDPLNYTYTATEDLLHIIRPLLLEELLASVPETLRPAVISALSQYVPPDDPIKIVISFAKVPADFDGDGQVGIPDFLLFVKVFGTQSGQENFDPKFDLDSDGTIGISDFLIFMDSFGKTVNG